MIEMRWKPISLDTELPGEGVVKLFKPSPPDALAVRTVEVCCYAVLQYREVGSYTRVIGDGVTEGLTTLEYDWQDVELDG